MTPENRIGHIEPTPVRVTPTEQPVFDVGNDRQRQVLERLEQGFEAAATEEGMVRWLKTVSKFHDYSLSNTILIAVQDPEATQVMGYKKWQEVGRQVQKGSTATKIFFPIFGKVPDPDTGEEVRIVRSYGIGNVFDIRHTEGEPLPEHPGKEAIKALERSDERAAEVNKRLGWWLIGEGLEVSSEPMHGYKLGYYAPHKNKVALRQVEGVDPLNVQMTKTLVHEAAHFAAQHTADMNRGLAEVVAECSAFVVMDRFGFDTGDYSFTYVAGWANGDTAVFKQGMADIKQVSGVLIDAIEHSTPEYVSEPGTGSNFRDDDFGTTCETGQ
jgi:antirestriction protein ArdC